MHVDYCDLRVLNRVNENFELKWFHSADNMVLGADAYNKYKEMDNA